MSYPRKLKILIVEDDSEVIQAYRDAFADWQQDGLDLGNPVFARSREDAEKRIAASEIYHVVILDMNLPIKNREAAIEGLGPGENLLELLERRTTYPIPVVLVVSGRLNEAERLNDLQNRLTERFWHGSLVNKGANQFQEIRNGLYEAFRYVDVGLHTRDSGTEQFPTLSPQEDDLLRRCVLDQDALGVDLRWWSAETGPSISRPNYDFGPTKVLMGSFLLDDGLGLSIPTFFKFEPSGNGPFVLRDSRVLSQKLAHVKVIHFASSLQRSLLVTQSVTSNAWPISLTRYLQKNGNEVTASIDLVVNQIIEQLGRLATSEDDEVLPRDFFYPWIDTELIKEVWDQADPHVLKSRGYKSPLDVYEATTSSMEKCWAPRRHCIHGDLNATNVAIDADNEGAPQAYIFDAAGVTADFELRDLATLEITTILFNSVGIDADFFEACQVFYSAVFLPEKPSEPSSDFARNVFTLIFEIRKQLIKPTERVAYALLLFNTALAQMYGLGVQSSPNNIKSPIHACMLASWIADWIPHIAPSLFADEHNLREDSEKLA